MTIDAYLEGFTEEPGYLDYGRVGPLSTPAAEEALALTQVLQRARYGSLDVFREQDARVRAAASDLTGFPVEAIVFQPNTSQGVMHALFGLTGSVLLSPGEFPSLPIAAVRAQEALHSVQPVWLETDHGKVTPGQIREQLESNVAAVAVSLVDSRTGYLCDIEGIRQVIGDRLLIVDAIQGFGIVDAPWEVADVVLSGGQKWCRAGWGTGIMALSARALERLTPVFSGFTGTEEAEPWGEVPPPAPDARAYRVSNRRGRDQQGGRRARERGDRPRRRVRDSSGELARRTGASRHRRARTACRPGHVPHCVAAQPRSHGDHAGRTGAAQRARRDERGDARDAAGGVRVVRHGGVVLTGWGGIRSHAAACARMLRNPLACGGIRSKING